jgi:dihydrofolate synthase/folylpolyglutamate synthase
MDQDIVEWLLTHYGQEQFQPGLERINNAIAPILPQIQKMKIITIAGTNGKGETTLRLSELIKNKTHCVWISPHIERITERFRSEKGEIELDELWKLIQATHEIVLRDGLKLSFYEFLFFVFCRWADQVLPEILLLEVGLGGRYDAVNALDAELILLPSISRDHQEFLGNRYDLILKEKLGLLRANSTLLSFLSLDYLRERAEAYAQGIGAKFIDLENVSPIPTYEFSLRNQFLAYAAFLTLEKRPISMENWHPDLNGLEHRGEVWREGAEWIFFGSHNADGLRKLIQFLHSGNYNFPRPPFDTVIAAFSRRDLRDLKVMLRMLKSSGLGKVVISTFPHLKAASKELMESLSRQEGLDFVEDVETCVQGRSSGQVLVLGSYYFMGHVQSLIRR